MGLGPTVLSGSLVFWLSPECFQTADVCAGRGSGLEPWDECFRAATSGHRLAGGCSWGGGDRDADRGAVALAGSRTLRMARCGGGSRLPSAPPRLAGRNARAGCGGGEPCHRVSLVTHGARRRDPVELRDRAGLYRADRALGCLAAIAALLVRQPHGRRLTQRLAAGRTGCRGDRVLRHGRLSLEAWLQPARLARARAIGRPARPGSCHLRALRPCRRDRAAGGDAPPPLDARARGNRPGMDGGGCGGGGGLRCQPCLRRMGDAILVGGDGSSTDNQGGARAGRPQPRRFDRRPATALAGGVRRPRSPLRPDLLARMQWRLLRGIASLVQRSRTDLHRVARPATGPAAAGRSCLPAPVWWQDLQRLSRTAQRPLSVGDPRGRRRADHRLLPQAAPDAVWRICPGHGVHARAAALFSDGRRSRRRAGSDRADAWRQGASGCDALLRRHGAKRCRITRRQWRQRAALAHQRLVIQGDAHAPAAPAARADAGRGKPPLPLAMRGDR